MGGKSPNSVYVTIQMSTDEHALLMDEVRKSGLNRNAFFRRFIASLKRS